MSCTNLGNLYFEGLGGLKRGSMRLFPGQRRLLATLIALGGCSLLASCDPERARDSAVSAAPAPAPVEPEAAPSASAVAPKKAEPTVQERRCTPDETNCLPELYNGRDDMIVGTVAGAPYKYKPGQKRYPLLNRLASEGACEHDGDCLARLPCTECVSRLSVPPSHPCPATYSTELDGAFCGCVEARCRWFTQRLTQRAVSSTKNLEVRLDGVPATDKTLLAEAAELFDLDLATCYYPRKSLLPARHKFVMTVGKYGAAETTVSGAHPSVRKCVSDAFDDMTRGVNWISDDFLEHGEIRFSGVIAVEMAWVP